MWRENLRLSPVKDLTQLIQITVKDATKCGDTVIIGICTLPLTKLLNQTSQNFWISLLPPIGKYFIFSFFYFFISSFLYFFILLFFIFSFFLNYNLMFVNVSYNLIIFN